MLLGPWQRFASTELEGEYQRQRRGHLARADMWSAALFVLLWAHDVWRFLGASPLALAKATVWMAAVGLKPVYVMAAVGRDFYSQYRTWIIGFTKVVFAVHPPGEGLRLLQPAEGATQAPGTLRVLWELAVALRLPYMLVTGLGWRDLIFNVPIQLVLVARAARDAEAHCAAPFFKAPQAHEVLGRLAGRLTSLLSASLYLGAGIKGQQPGFPASLDPCQALGTWAAICLGFVLTTAAVAADERSARSRFARRRASRLTPAERQLLGSDGTALSWAPWALIFAYICLLAWQAVVAALVWMEDGRHNTPAGLP